MGISAAVRNDQLIVAESDAFLALHSLGLQLLACRFDRLRPLKVIFKILCRVVHNTAAIVVNL